MNNKVPVAFFVYNRPKHTSESFEKIKLYKPSELFIISDGPKKQDELDKLKVENVNRIIQKIDWSCEVKRLIADTNLGLKKRLESGLNWVFENTDACLILEDDCVASVEFFSFIEENLRKYQNNREVMSITGNNFLRNSMKRKIVESYYFSKYPHCWGWATWSRAWKLYEGEIKFWSNFKYTQEWKDLHSNDKENSYWTEIFDQVYLGKINSWAYPWTASIWYNQGCTVTPVNNLVRNIGFDADSTHTVSQPMYLRKKSEIRINRNASPIKIKVNTDLDEQTFKIVFNPKQSKFKYVIAKIYCYISSKFRWYR